MISQLQALRQAHHDRDDLAALERFLLDDTAPLPSLDLLERTRLAAYAYTRTPRHHPDKLALRPAFVAATRRHQQAKAALTPLFQAWYAAGIEVLLFKGFYLAEFVYDAPAQRFYGDVDALIDPRHAAAARRIAVSLGWTVVAELTDSTLPHIHELMSLRSPDGMVYLEVHRRILQNYLPVSRLQQRFTDRAWQASVTHPWQGITVRALEPRDNILLGLILNRFWFADRWTFKPHDPLDMQQTMTRHQLSSDDLRRRADELGCRRTLDIFLSRCHPGRGVLHLAPPDKQQQQRWNWQISGERLACGAGAPSAGNAT
ncbi:MAG: nucleotidyltransferase family protein [Trueperaceae bacterium]|nr:nucleotidyltransferase family protein [Trueperaceae bacterium]